MRDLNTLLKESAERHHNHLCPRQVLGVRMGMYAAELLALDLPQGDKRLFTFVEMDGCLTDGVAVATGCSVGRRTLRVMDYGKTAATFVDTETDRAIRIAPAHESRERAWQYAPDAPDRWRAQLTAYQVMPNAELFAAQEVALTVSLEKIISQHGLRVVCEECGEDIVNARYVRTNGKLLCRPCALGGYYRTGEARAPKSGSVHSHKTCEVLETSQVCTTSPPDLRLTETPLRSKVACARAKIP